MQAFSSCGTTTTRTGGYRSWRCAGSSLQWLLLLQSTGSRYVSFSSFSSWAQQLWDRGVLRSIWDCPRPGIESGSPALQGRFLTIGPPGSPLGGNSSQDFSLLLGQSSAFLHLLALPTHLKVYSEALTLHFLLSALTFQQRNQTQQNTGACSLPQLL